MRIHCDKRRDAYCDLFDTPDGDVNVFYIKPGERTCWHRHQRQTDQFRVLRGEITIGMIEDGVHKYYTYNSPRWLLTVPPGTWHGYENAGKGEAILLMYLDQKYDPDDEERSDEIPWEAV